jgi:hypothetical protein
MEQSNAGSPVTIIAFAEEKAFDRKARKGKIEKQDASKASRLDASPFPCQIAMDLSARAPGNHSDAHFWAILGGRVRIRL